MYSYMQYVLCPVVQCYYWVYFGKLLKVNEHITKRSFDILQLASGGATDPAGPPSGVHDGPNGQPTTR